MVQQISAAEAKARLEADAACVLLDVRTPGEHELAHVERGILIPMQEIADRVDELDPAAETLVLCHHGMRSQQVALFLQSRGFVRVFNVSGGIDAWSQRVDSTVPRY